MSTRRELALIRAELPAWLAELKLSAVQSGVVHGCPDLMDDPVGQFHPGITDLIPVTTVTVRGSTAASCERIRTAAAMPTVLDLALVDISGEKPAAAAAALTASPWLSQLRTLRLFGLPVTDASALALLTSLPRLRSLELGSSTNEVKLSKRELDAIVAAPAFQQLRDFALKNTAIKAPGARAICSKANQLEALTIDQAKLGAEGAQAVLTSDAMPGWARLSLGVNALGAEPAPTIGAALAGSLHRLELPLNEIGDAWIRQFLATPLALTHLGLRSNPISAAGIKTILESPMLAALESLSVAAPSRSVPAWGTYLPAIVALPGFAKLRAFDADSAGITSEGIEALAASPHARGLRNLRLGYSSAGVTGAKAIANSDMLGNLEALDLSSARLGDAGVVALCASEKLSKLKYLALSGNKLGESGFAALLNTRAFPQLRVLRLYEAKEPRRSALEQHLGALVDVGDRVGAMGRWLRDDFLG